MNKGMIYKTVYARGTAEIVEKKSRFIANVAPVSTEEEAINEYVQTLDDLNFAKRHPEHLVLDGANKVILAPSHPEVIKFVTDTIMEVVDNYDVEGVHIDDYFYPYAKIPFEREEQDYLKYRKSEEETFEDWRRRNVDMMIESIHEGLKKSFNKNNKKVLFGISPFAIYRTHSSIKEGGWDKGSYNAEGGLQCYNELYSDVYKWMKENWIDYVVPQVYFSFERLDEGLRIAVQSEHTGGTTEYKSEHNEDLDKLCSYATSVLSEKTEFVYEEEIPLAVQIITSKNEVVSYQVDYFNSPEEYEKFGYEMTYFRPPKGEFSERVIKNVKDLNYTTVMWSSAYDDWDDSKQGRVEYGKKKILDNLHNGAIILLHSTSEDNMNLLDDLIIFLFAVFTIPCNFESKFFV